MHLDKVLARHFPEAPLAYTFKDTILYALGVGIGADPLNPDNLRFLYEDGLVAMPTMANVLGHPGFWVKEEEYGVDWKQLLHAEHRLTIHQPLPAEGTVIARNSIMGIRDKGSSAMMHQQKLLVDAASGAPISTTITTLMLRGDGGCGDFGDVPADFEKLPETAPDQSVDVTVDEVLPLIYRLSGDLNPLHIDPEVATVAGFPRPIFHGLGTMGIAAFALIKHCAGFDPARLASMAVRFSRPVLPGDRIRFDFWGTGPGTVRFRASVPDRDGIVVLDRCTAELT